jgi:DNA replication protein DnaC
MKQVADYVTSPPPHSGHTIGKGITAVPCTLDQVKAYYELVSLDTLSTEGMTNTQAKQFSALLTKVREWRTAVKQRPGLSMLIMSKQVGIGKTHIAKAVVSSFSAVIGELAYANNKPMFALERRARFYTARELVAMLGGDNAVDLCQIVPRHVDCLVIDDLGREGYIDFVQAGEQKAEKQARYFHLFNHLYERRQPPSIFVTTNLNEKEMVELLGDAVWSRLLEMCPRGYIVELHGLADYRRKKSGRRWE